MEQAFDYEAYYEDYWTTPHHEHAYYEHSFGHIKKALRPHGLAVDIGGGNGMFLEWLGIRDGVVIDVSETGVSKAREKGYDAHKVDLTKPLPAALHGRFQTAYCFEVLEHIGETGLVLSNAYAALKPGGVLWVAVPNCKPDGIHHKRQWKRDEMVADLEKAGFKVVLEASNTRFTLDPMPPITGWRKPVFYGVRSVFPPSLLKWTRRNFCKDLLASAFIFKAVKQA